MTDHELDDHPEVVLAFRPSPAGGVSGPGPVIVSIDDRGHRRVSKVRRGDGSTFTVTVPAGGVDREPVPHERTAPWIREDTGRRRGPVIPLDGLAARVGLRLLPDPPAGPSGT